MNNKTTIITVFLLAIFLVGSASVFAAPKNNVAAAAASTVLICHNPGTGSQQELEVNANAVDGHLGHGDYLGPCQALPVELSCENASLVGTINGGQANVTNNGTGNYTISLVTYQMYAALIDDQTFFDSETQVVAPGQTAVFNVDVPACGYQIDLVCGEPIVDEAPYYGFSVIATAFENQDNYCIHEEGSSGEGIFATLSIAPYFPQNNSYVFICDTTGFAPTSYNWYYGDGQILYNTALDNVYHTYNTGTYTLTCVATDGSDWAIDTMEVVVN